jgi:hypothetical protein
LGPAAGTPSRIEATRREKFLKELGAFTDTFVFPLPYLTRYRNSSLLPFQVSIDPIDKRMNGGIGSELFDWFFNSHVPLLTFFNILKRKC